MEKAILCLENGVKGKEIEKERDADEIFAQFVASELRSIKDPNVKRLAKWNIQSVLYESGNATTSTSTPGSWYPAPFPYTSPNASMLSYSSSIATQGYTSSTED